MKNISMNMLMPKLFIIGSIFLAAASVALDRIPVTVTVAEGATHTFKGMGASSVNGNTFQRLPLQTQRDMVNVFWLPVAQGGMGWNVIRFWGGLDNSKEYFLTRYKTVYDRVKEANPNTTILMGPTGNPTTVESYAQHYVNLIKDIREDIKVDYTGIANEPNANLSFRAEDVPQYVKAFRKYLDEAGLTKDSVKIIAPEASNVDDYFFATLEALTGDADALAQLDAFSSHSYNMCVLRMVQTWLTPYGKDYWQTECSDNGAEGFNDSINAVKGLARVISDINLGTNVWVWFIAFHQFDPWDNATRIMGWNEDDGSWYPLLKFYYFRAFSRAYDINAGVRLCTSNLSSEDRQIYMENWYGKKPGICAGAVQNPGGDWAFTVANQSGIISNWDGAQFPSAAIYDVTFVVPELANSPDMTFKVMRTNNSVRNAIVDEVTMSQGQFTVAVNPMDLVCVRADFDTNFYALPDFDVADDYGPCGMGFGFALLPPLVISAGSMVRRRAKKRNMEKA